MNKTGKLEEIVDTQVNIDGTWYDGTPIAKFFPRETGIEVEYSEKEGVLTYMRKVGAFTPKGASFPGKQGFTGGAKGFVKTNGNSPSIVKQCIFKAAIVISTKFAYGSTDECIVEVNRIYNDLKEKYYDELVSN